MVGGIVRKEGIVRRSFETMFLFFMKTPRTEGTRGTMKAEKHKSMPILPEKFELSSSQKHVTEL
jgi:hypothetical protein